MSRTSQATTRRAVLGMAAAAGTLLAAPRSPSAQNLGANPIKLGIQGDLTGALAHDGMWEQRAILAAVEWHNGRGGIAGRKIQLFSADTETKTDVGIRRLQQLIQENGCDFVVGSGSGGIGVASVPIAKEAQVVYLPLSRTDSITTETPNPWLYRLVSNSSIAARACQSWMVETVGKRWAVVLSDIAFGHSQEAAFTAALTAAGGQVVQSIALPSNGSDPLPYLLRLDKSVDGIVTALWGPDSLRVYPALMAVGAANKPKLAVSSTADLFDVLRLGASVEGLYCFDEVPWELSDYPDPKLTEVAFQEIGIGPNGRAAKGDDFVMLPSAIVAWEYVSFLKRAIEGSGWARREDGLKMSKWVAGNPALPVSAEFLRPDLTIRPQDQQGFADAYILRVQAGRMRVVKRVPAAETIYPPLATISR